MGNTVFSMNLEETSVNSVQDYIHSKVQEIKVITRTVDIPVVKYLGAKHMFLVLKLEDDILVINHVTDDNEEDDEKNTVVLDVNMKALRVTLQDIISKAKYSEDNIQNSAFNGVLGVGAFFGGLYAQKYGYKVAYKDDESSQNKQECSEVFENADVDLISNHNDYNSRSTVSGVVGLGVIVINQIYYCVQIRLMTHLKIKQSTKKSKR
ncbi:hypothetical protein ABPG72_018548 [Tetrahymena utriculariae]